MYGFGILFGRDSPPINPMAVRPPHLGFFPSSSTIIGREETACFCTACFPIKRDRVEMPWHPLPPWKGNLKETDPIMVDYRLRAAFWKISVIISCNGVSNYWIMLLYKLVFGLHLPVSIPHANHTDLVLLYKLLTQTASVMSTHWSTHCWRLLLFFLLYYPMVKSLHRTRSGV